jgi:hypothetical protein
MSFLLVFVDISWLSLVVLHEQSGFIIGPCDAVSGNRIAGDSRHHFLHGALPRRVLRSLQLVRLHACVFVSVINVTVFTFLLSFDLLMRGVGAKSSVTLHSAPGKPASHIRILDERAEDGSINIHISGVIKVEVASVEEVMRSVLSWVPFLTCVAIVAMIGWYSSVHHKIAVDVQFL